MKKAHLVVLEEDKDILLQALQKNGNIMLIEQEEDKEVNNTKIDEAIVRVKESLKILQPYQEKKKFITEVTEVKYEDFLNFEKTSVELVDEIRKINLDIEIMENEIALLKEKNLIYFPWKDFSFKLNEIENTKFTIVHVGIMRLDKMKLFFESVSDLNVVHEFHKINATFGSLILFSYSEDDRIVDEKLKYYDFQETTLPKSDSTANEIIGINNKKIAVLLSKIENSKLKLQELAKKQNEIELYSDQIHSLKELHNASYKDTLDAIYLEGWVPESKCASIEKSVSSVTDFYDIKFTDPEEDEIPPTKLENNAFVKPFETVTEMFATPAQGEVDPNPVMSIWYWIIFGMMMGDVGYGAIMLIFSLLFIKIKKPRGGTRKMLMVFTYTGVSTIIWGILFGSLFGFGFWKPVLVAPIEEPLTLLIVSIIVGALHIITGLLTKAYGLIKNGKFWDAFFDQISWVAILVGIGFIFIPVLIYVAYGLIGFIDDYIIVVQKNNEGLKPAHKFLLQSILAVVFFFLYRTSSTTDIWIPIFNVTIDLSWFYFILVFFMFTAETNAVNLTVGLDGLCAVQMVIALVPFVVFALMQGLYNVACLICLVIFALLGYLKFNKHPAQIFMGDTGSLALGGLIAAVAMVLK